MLAVSDTRDRAEHFGISWHFLQKENKKNDLKFWLHRVPLKMTLQEHKSFAHFRVFPMELSVFFPRNHLHSIENMKKKKKKKKKFDYIIASIE